MACAVTVTDSTPPAAVFVPATAEAPSAAAHRHGIRRGGGTRRLLAAERVARALGVVVPRVDAAVVDGIAGTWREQVEAATALSEVRRGDPARAASIEASAAWVVDRAAVAVLDYALGTVARDDTLVLVLSLGRTSHHCIAAPSIECLGPQPTPQRPPYDAITVVPWTAAAAAGLGGGDQPLDAQLRIQGLLSPEELTHLADRLAEVAAAD
jgi:hypothetical protein